MNDILRASYFLLSVPLFVSCTSKTRLRSTRNEYTLENSASVLHISKAEGRIALNYLSGNNQFEFVQPLEFKYDSSWLPVTGVISLEEGRRKTGTS